MVRAINKFFRYSRRDDSNENAQQEEKMQISELCNSDIDISDNDGREKQDWVTATGYNDPIGNLDFKALKSSQEDKL